MEYFMHSTFARYAPALKKLEQDYGLAGYGFFWKAVELIFACNGVANFGALLALRARPLRYVQAAEIIRHCELFVVNEAEASVSINREIKNGLYVMPEKKKRSRTKSATHVGTGVGTDAGTDAGTEVPTEARTGASGEASVCAGPIEQLKEEEKNKSENDTATHSLLEKEREQEQALMTFMASRCPTLLEMEEPLTLEQYLRLRRLYRREEIEQVLIDIHNDTRNVYWRSCFDTAVKWLRIRKTAPLVPP